MRLAVTGAGMVTSVGYGLVGSCTAIRAGLSRPSPLDGLEVGDDDEGAVPAVGYPATAITSGFFQNGAWVQLAAGAVNDLQHRSDLPGAADVRFWERTAMVVLLPVLDEDRFGWTLETSPNAVGECYIGPLLERTGLEVSPERASGLTLGSCGLARGLHLGREAMLAGKLDRVLFVAADSYVDAMTLAWLVETNRLKTQEQPVGLMPGEAGACLLVETEAAARARSAEIVGYVGAAPIGAAPGTERAAEVDLGRNLADVVARACGKVTRFDGSLVADLNGEEWRAYAWGNALMHLSSRVDLSGCESVVPSESLGEVGAASPVVGSILSLFGFVMDGTSQALVWSMSDTGQVAAIRLSAAEAGAAS